MAAQAAAESNPLKTALDIVGELGVSAVEIQVDIDRTTPHLRQPDGSVHSIATDAGLAALRDDLKTRGLGASALLLATDFSAADPAPHVEWALAAIAAAERLGAQAIRVDPLARDKQSSRDTIRDNFISGITRVLKQSPGSSVDLGMENHGPVGNEPAFIDEVLSAVNDLRLGLTLDTGNFYWWGVPLETLYALLAQYAGRAKHTHIKSINYPIELATSRRPIGLDYGKYCCALDEGNLDLARVVKILRNAGYTRNLCIENESLGKFKPAQRLEILRRDVSALTRAATSAQA